MSARDAGGSVPTGGDAPCGQRPDGDATAQREGGGAAVVQQAMENAGAEQPMRGRAAVAQQDDEDAAVAQRDDEDAAAARHAGGNAAVAQPGSGVLVGGGGFFAPCAGADAAVTQQQGGGAAAPQRHRDPVVGPQAGGLAAVAPRPGGAIPAQQQGGPAGACGTAPLRIVVLGLSITSSWGNGHATTYRGLVRELVRRGHDVLFLERDVPWYAAHRDLPHPPFGRTALYADLDGLRRQHGRAVGEAHLVIVGSYVPEGVAVGDWVQAEASGVRAFYDIDTPVTLAQLGRGDTEYLQARQIAGYDLYLSFTGGPTLDRLEREFGSPAARVLYCSVDPELYRPEHLEPEWDLGYMGTYSDDRQPTVESLLIAPALAWKGGSFVVAGPQYPADMRWSPNVRYLPHLPPAEHAAFYNRQRYTLNVTRADMIEAGWSPSVRLFEAAACATPIISDRWAGLETLLEPGCEIFLADTPGDVLHLLRELPEEERRACGERARARILAEHTAAHRAAELEAHVRAVGAPMTA